jgi:hypothetical protein
MRQCRITRLTSLAAMPHNPHMTAGRITIVETSVFTRRAEKLLSVEEREALVDFLAANPEAGDDRKAMRAVVGAIKDQWKARR